MTPTTKCSPPRSHRYAGKYLQGHAASFNSDRDITIYKERSHTPWLVAACRLLQSGNSPSVEMCMIFNFPLLRMHARCWCFEAVSHNRRPYRSRRRLTEVLFPPRSDWVANYRPACASVSVDLTLAPHEPPTLAARGRRSLCHRPGRLLPACSEAHNGDQGVDTSAEPLDEARTDSVILV